MFRSDEDDISTFGTTRSHHGLGMPDCPTLLDFSDEETRENLMLGDISFFPSGPPMTRARNSSSSRSRSRFRSDFTLPTLVSDHEGFRLPCWKTLGQEEGHDSIVLASTEGHEREKTTDANPASASQGAETEDCDGDEDPSPYSAEPSQPFDFYISPRGTGRIEAQPWPPRRLGLLEGKYRVSCPALDQEYPGYNKVRTLTATLDGDLLWLKLDFGAITGMLMVSRPHEASDAYNCTFWRGTRLYGSTNLRYAQNDTVDRAGWFNYLIFLGSGHIHGSLRSSAAKPITEFDAYRIAEQPNAPGLSPVEARAEWARLKKDFKLV